MERFYLPRSVLNRPFIRSLLTLPFLRRAPLLLFFWFFLTDSIFPADPPHRIAALDQTGRDWVDKTLSAMSAEEKIGQLIIPSFSARNARLGSKSLLAMLGEIRKLRPGGIHLSSGNLQNIIPILNRLQKESPIPLLICADLEGGTGFRFSGATRIPRAMAIGATGDTDSAYQAGVLTALEARPLGIHVNFYPVADVNNNPLNPIINIRSFGENPQEVQKMVCSYLRGLQENGMAAVVKHFPGHGDTSTDSHLDLPVIDVPLERLRQVELPPFQAAVKEGVIGVMAGHLAVPALEPEKRLPATLSSKILTVLLRQEMGFTGLIFTDAMSMSGFTDLSLPHEAIVHAILAGADMLLAPQNFSAASQALRLAVRQGRIAPERLDASVRRILETKARLGLNRYQPANPSFAGTLLLNQDHKVQAQQIMENAVTLVRDDRQAIPLRLARSKKIFHLRLLDTMNWKPKPGTLFADELKKRHPNTITLELGKQSPALTRTRIEQAWKRCDAVVIGIFVRVTSGKGTVDLSPQQTELLKKIAAGSKPLILVVFGSPYLLVSLPDLPSYIATFEYCPDAEKAAIKAIFGEIPFRGRLPVSLGSNFPVGFGIRMP